MSRARATALALVNWKGVFFERYLLDPQVTALEGANGAGKTTVMIAAYLVLLPDLARLRFTNLGETGATGGDRGIWGRLGEPGRPSYAVLDFALPANGRLLAGVHLERKGEPSVEPTPFVVLGLAEDVRLQDLLLLPQGDSEVVPELAELRENAHSATNRNGVVGSTGSTAPSTPSPTHRIPSEIHASRTPPRSTAQYDPASGRGRSGRRRSGRAAAPCRRRRA